MGWGNPKVSGVLPVALGDGTKVIGVLMQSSKEYIAVMQLHRDVSEDRLRQVVSEFIGEIYQKPPVKSSVKRVLRIKRIYNIEVLEVKYPFVLLKVSCEHGTYVRKLIHDIGEVLGTGAHMRELRRVRTGPFKEDETLTTLHKLSEATYMYRVLGDGSYLRRYILPIEYAVSHLPKIVVVDGAVEALTHGADLAVPGISRLHEGIQKGELVAIFTLKGELVSLGKALMTSEEILENEKGMAVKNSRVIMPKGIYPRLWGRYKIGKQVST